MKRLFKKITALVLGFLTIAGLAGLNSNSVEPVVKAEAVNVTGEKLYFMPSKMWREHNAWFAAYYYGNNGDAWTSFVNVGEIESDKPIYVTSIPSGSWTNVIFVRMDPSATSGSWDHKWAQTVDLSFDSNLLFKMSADDTSWETDGNWTSLHYYLKSAGKLSRNYTIFCKVAFSVSKLNAYMWQDSTGTNNSSWPGKSMTKVADNLYAISVDVTKGFDKIIFNDGSWQTGDLMLTAYSAFYNVTGIDENTTTHTINDTSIQTVPFISNETVDLAKVMPELGLASNSVTFKAQETGYGVIDYSAGKFQLDSSLSMLDFEKYSTGLLYLDEVSTCDKYSNYAEYRKLKDEAKIEDDRRFNETYGDLTTTTVLDKINYMEAYANSKKTSSNLSSYNLLSNITSSNNILIVLIVGLLGLTTVGAYYFLNKKKYAK